MTKKYELLLVLPGTLDDKEVEIRSQEVLNVVKEYGADVEISAMGKNRLAYPVKQIRYGYFYTIVFNAEPAQVIKLEQKLRLMRDVLRALVSYFNTQLTASQKIAYTTDAAGVTTMTERTALVTAMESETALATAPVVAEAMVNTSAVVETTSEEDVAKKSVNARKIDKLDLEAINKKLDDLMSGDVIPGV